MGDNEKAIIRTLIYSNMFLFPLTYEELYFYLHADKSIKRSIFNLSLKKTKTKLIFKDGLYALPSAEKHIRNRVKLRLENERKYKIALSMAGALSHIPTVCFIGITGSLAVKNAKQNDDIDFIVIAENKTLFATRMICLLLLQLYGKRRKKDEENPKDKICLNLMMTKNGMGEFATRKNIYIAREIAQIEPLFNRENTYSELLKQNMWITTYMPNAHIKRKIPIKRSKTHFIGIFSMVEFICKKLQLSIMLRGKKSKKNVDDFLAFYPHHREELIIKRYIESISFYSKYYNTNL